MIAPKIPENEAARLQELYKYELLDSVYDEEFDELIQLASGLCNVPISLITLVDSNRQWFKAKLGLDVAETDRNVSFCAHAILEDGLFEIADTNADERFYDNPLVVGEPNIRYYAGMPLVTNSGYKIGTLCVIDRIPRKMNKEQAFALKVLSGQVIKLFEMRVRNKELKKVRDVQQKIMTVMAHDVRGALASIKITYELKNDGTFSAEDVKEIESLIPQQLDSTLNLLDNIVDWGKLQLGRPKEKYDKFNLHNLCDECIGYLVMPASAKNNKFVNNVDPAFEVRHDKQGLEFVLRNLLGNANKFTAGGTISIRARVIDNSTEIVVTDTGIGIPDVVMKSLISRTWTAHTAGTNNEQGSGMGLKLIYEYLDKVNGTIDFTSTLGKGTLVAVRLPLL